LSSSLIGFFIVFSLQGINKMKVIAPDQFEYIKNSLKINFRGKHREN